MTPAQLVAGRRQVPSQMNAVPRGSKGSSAHDCASSTQRSPPASSSGSASSRKQVRRSGRPPEPPIGPPALQVVVGGLLATAVSDQQDGRTPRLIVHRGSSDRKGKRAVQWLHLHVPSFVDQCNPLCPVKPGHSAFLNEPRRMKKGDMGLFEQGLRATIAERPSRRSPVSLFCRVSNRCARWAQTGPRVGSWQGGVDHDVGGNPGRTRVSVPLAVDTGVTFERAADVVLRVDDRPVVV